MQFSFIKENEVFLLKKMEDNFKYYRMVGQLKLYKK